MSGRRWRAARAAVETARAQVADLVLEAIGAPGSKVYSFGYAINGFAAALTGAQAASLAQREEVERIWLDRDVKVRTNNSSTFMGLLDADNGLRARHDLTGEGIVVGVINTTGVGFRIGFMVTQGASALGTDLYSVLSLGGALTFFGIEDLTLFISLIFIAIAYIFT